MIKVGKEAIREKVDKKIARDIGNLNIKEAWYTPSGNMRKSPRYKVTVKNKYLNEVKQVNKKTLAEAEADAKKKIKKWAKKEIKNKIKEQADTVWKKNRTDLEERLTTLKTILESIAS